MDIALRRLYHCHSAGNCAGCSAPPRTQVQAHATTAAANLQLSLAQRALLQVAAKRKLAQQQVQDGQQQQQQQQQQLRLSPELRGSLFRAHQLAGSSPEEFEQLMADHERRQQVRLRQQQQQSQQHHQQQTQSRKRKSQQQHGLTSAPQQSQQQQQQQQPAAGADASPAEVQQRQQRLLLQQLQLHQLLKQQQQRKRRLQLQVRQEPAVLTDLIKRSTSWQRLSQLFSTMTPLFNPIHVSAAITHLAQLQDEPGIYEQLIQEKDTQSQAYKQFIQDLTAAAAACIPDFGPRQIANSMWAINRLGASSLVTRKLRNAFLQAFVYKLQFAAPQHVAMTAAAVANMDWTSSTKWRSQILNAVPVRLPYFKPLELAILVHAVARLDVNPSDQWLGGVLAACYSHMHSFSLQELSMLGVGLVRLQERPDQEWLAAYMHAVQQQLTPVAASAANAAGSAWTQGAAGSMYLQQPPLQQHAEHWHAEVGSSSGGTGRSSFQQGTAHAAAAAAAAEGAPAEDDSEVDLSVWGDGGYDPQYTGVRSLVNVLWVLAKWQVVPPGGWQACCLAAVEQLLGDLSIQGVSTMLWSFARLQMQAPRVLVLRLLRHAQPLLLCANSTDVAMLVWAIGSLGITAPALAAESTSPAAAGQSSSRNGPSWGSNWLNDFVYHSYRVLSGCSAADVTTLLVGAVRMRLRPGSQWLRSVVVEAWHRLPDMTPVQLTSTLLCMARLPSCKPGNGFLQDYCTHSQALLTVTAAHLTRKRYYRTRQEQRQQQQLEHEVADIWHDVSLTADAQQDVIWANLDAAAAPSAEATGAVSATQNYTPQCLANTLGALALLGYRPSQQWCSSFFAASAALLPSFTGRDFAYTIWALALLETQPPQAWMDAYLVELRAHVPIMTSQQLSAVIWALARLNHRPGVDWMNPFLDRVVALTPQAKPAGSSSSGSAGGVDVVSSSRGRDSESVGSPAPPSPLQLSGYFSAIILQGLTAWAASSLDLGFDGSSSCSSSSFGVQGRCSSHGSSEGSSAEDNAGVCSESSSRSGDVGVAVAQPQPPKGKRRVLRRLAQVTEANAQPAATSVDSGHASGTDDTASEQLDEQASSLPSRIVSSDGSIMFRF